MNAPIPAAIIQGSLVDAKNVATHRCVRLSIDVPAELGAQIVEAFGWPTMAEPVHVAVARLVDGAKQEEPSKEKRTFSDLPSTTQAALTCKEPRFWAYLREEQSHECQTEDEAADFVRLFCQVESRSELKAQSKAAHRWHFLISGYYAWLEAT